MFVCCMAVRPWPTKIEDIRKMQRSEMRMLRWMTGVSLSERKSNECEECVLMMLLKSCDETG